MQAIQSSVRFADLGPMVLSPADPTETDNGVVFLRNAGFLLSIARVHLLANIPLLFDWFQRWFTFRY